LQLPAPWLDSPQILHPWKLVQASPKLQEEDRAQPKQNCLPLGASMACLLLAVGASFAVGLPDMVRSALQSAGKWSGRPHRKQWARWRFLGVWAELSEGRLHFGDEEAGGPTLNATGRVAMMVSAARSRLPKSCDGLRATASRCWISYSMAVSQLCERPRSITSLWWAEKASARISP